MTRRHSANAVEIREVVFVQDPYAYALISPLTAEIGSRLAGHGGAVFVGDKGDPTQRYDGYVANGQQHFTGAAAVLGTPSMFRDRQSYTIESSMPGTYTGEDPARRMFADRLRRRSA